MFWMLLFSNMLKYVIKYYSMGQLRRMISKHFYAYFILIYLLSATSLSGVTESAGGGTPI